MFRVEMHESMAENYVSEEVEIDLIEVAVVYIDNRTKVKGEIVMTFAVRQGAEKDEYIKDVKEICKHLGFSYLGIGEILVKKYTFDAMETFIKL